MMKKAAVVLFAAILITAALLAAALAAVSGCMADAPVAATASPVPEYAAEPTETPAASPSPECTAKPTETPAPTASPTPTPVPTATQTPLQEGYISMLNKELLDEYSLVDLRTIDGLMFDIRYAGSNNFAGHPIYPNDNCLLRKETADKLKHALETLNAKGYGLLIYDGYRPLRHQYDLYNATDEKEFVADPSRGGNHNRGAAVDLTLTDLETGEPLPMQSGFDEFSDRARRSWAAGEEETENLKVLTEAMTEAGFKTISNEWWHYDDTDRFDYPLLDIALDEF